MVGAWIELWLYYVVSIFPVAGNTNWLSQAHVRMYTYVYDCTCVCIYIYTYVCTVSRDWILCVWRSNYRWIGVMWRDYLGIPMPSFPSGCGVVGFTPMLFGAGWGARMVTSFFRPVLDGGNRWENMSPDFWNALVLVSAWGCGYGAGGSYAFHCFKIRLMVWWIPFFHEWNERLEVICPECQNSFTTDYHFDLEHDHLPS